MKCPDNTVVREQKCVQNSSVAAGRVELCNGAKEENREITGPFIKHMEICNVAAGPRGVRSVLAGRSLPLSCLSASCQLQALAPEDSSSPPPRAGQLWRSQTVFPRCLFM